MIRTSSSNYLMRIVRKNHNRMAIQSSKNEEKKHPSNGRDCLNKTPIIKGNKKIQGLLLDNKSLPRLSWFASPSSCFNINDSPDINKPIVNNQKTISIKTLNDPYLNYHDGYSSKKTYNMIKGYAYNSFEGTTDKANEDRITVEMQIKPPATYIGLTWPKVHFFGLYDGHGGTGCTNFLKKNLHTYITSNKYFPIDIQKAILKGFKKTEKEFLKRSIDIDSRVVIDDSGSCALIALFVDDKWFVANVGDSRGLLSIDSGRKWKDITTDHKPNEKNEMERILKHGGKIIDQYGIASHHHHRLNKYSTTTVFPKLKRNSNQLLDEDKIYRVVPGGLAVSRTFGDTKAKLKDNGRVSNIISAVPDIFIVNSSQADFLVLGCDGIFDVIKSKEVIDLAWEAISKINDSNVHNQSLHCVNMIIKSALAKESTDNVSCIIISFENLARYFFIQDIKKKKNCARSVSVFDQFKLKLDD